MQIHRWLVWANGVSFVGPMSPTEVVTLSQCTRSIRTRMTDSDPKNVNHSKKHKQLRVPEKLVGDYLEGP